jgi:hypothetical protein
MAMVRLFREGPGPYALALAMTGVRLGERQLLVGDDGALFAELAGKVGLTGNTCAVAVSEEVAVRLRAAAARAGVLMDVGVAPLPVLPVAAGSFDLALIDAGPTLLAALDASGRLELARSVFGALRRGARALVAERQVRRVFGLVRTQPRGLDAFRAEGGAIALLESAGFHPVRLLGEREGQRFTEGLKTGA